MPVGDKYAFLQFSDSSQATFANGITMTFSTGAQPDPAVRIQNRSTAGVFIAMGPTRTTSSAAVVAKGIWLPAEANGGTMVLRTGGETKLAAFTSNATHTVLICVTGGEGVL
jgi:hypothetical protein